MISLKIKMQALFNEVLWYLVMKSNFNANQRSRVPIPHNFCLFVYHPISMKLCKLFNTLVLFLARKKCNS